MVRQHLNVDWRRALESTLRIRGAHSQRMHSRWRMGPGKFKRNMRARIWREVEVKDFSDFHCAIEELHFVDIAFPIGCIRRDGDVG